MPNAYIFQELSKVMPEDAVIAVDVGNNAYAFGMYFEAKRQHVLMSGYLGSIGFAFPAAMGAWAAAPNRKIVAIAGDGGFGQYMAEFTTAVKYGMPITLILLNNSELAKISREQRGGNYHVWQTSLHNPNFADYADNCGGLGIRVVETDELRHALEKALAYDGPSIVEIISSADQL
jgi:thiamine pyrophosphate-dependent acetolactate synthase large subunit-like protein